MNKSPLLLQTFHKINCTYPQLQIHSNRFEFFLVEQIHIVRKCFLNFTNFFSVLSLFFFLNLEFSRPLSKLFLQQHKAGRMLKGHDFIFSLKVNCTHFSQTFYIEKKSFFFLIHFIAMVNTKNIMFINALKNHLYSKQLRFLNHYLVLDLF